MLVRPQRLRQRFYAVLCEKQFGSDTFIRVFCYNPQEQIFNADHMSLYPLEDQFTLRFFRKRPKTVFVI